MVIAKPHVELRSASGTLLIAVDALGVGGWCQVQLIAAGGTRPLGAEQWKYISAHLSSFLADTSPGQRWVFSLAERHTSAYGEHVAGAAVLHLEDADGRIFARLVLSSAEIDQWLHDMANFSST